MACYNIAVFAVVLLAFCLVMYGAVVEGLYEDIRSDLSRLADAAVSSIDYDDVESSADAGAGAHRQPAPDLIAEGLSDPSLQSLRDLRLQWFDTRGNLVSEKGAFHVDTPLWKSRGFQFQEKPRGMLFTKPVFMQGRLLGYVRVAQTLDEADRAVRHFLFAMLFGVGTASVVSGVGITFLIRKAMQPLYKNIKQLRQFTADASHELRTPVTAIVTNSSVALRHSDGMRDADRVKLTAILSASQQMATLVDELLQLDRLDSKQPGGLVASGAVDVSHLLEELRQLLAPLAESRDLELQWQVEPGLKVLGIADDLRNLYTNLIENAIRYTPAGGKVEVSAASVRQGDAVNVTIIDTGLGIADSDLPRIFDRFWRGENARSAFPTGSGLGLSIAKLLVDQLGGTIRVLSNAGSQNTGTTFVVELPSARDLHN
ncbi:MAG: HAMP domain-containing sensor histidine kinase [Candidatus Obscuribacterales bacterium]